MDDHPRNFSFQLIDNGWILSSYMTLGFSGYHSITVNNADEPKIRIKSIGYSHIIFERLVILHIFALLSSNMIMMQNN